MTEAYLVTLAATVRKVKRKKKKKNQRGLSSSSVKLSRKIGLTSWTQACCLIGASGAMATLPAVLCLYSWRMGILEFLSPDDRTNSRSIWNSKRRLSFIGNNPFTAASLTNFQTFPYKRTNCSFISEWLVKMK